MKTRNLKTILAFAQSRGMMALPVAEVIRAFSAMKCYSRPRIKNWNLKKGPKAIIEHANLMCEEYDLDICDLTVKEVVNSYYAYAATGYIVY